MTLRIAFLCDEYPPFRNGGIGTYTKEVAEGLAAKGHDVTVVGVFAGLKFDTICNEQGVRLICLAPSPFGLLGNRLKVYRQVRSLELTSGLDVLETQEFGGFLVGWPRTSFKIIVRLHGSVTLFNIELNNRTWKKLPWRLLEAATLRRADRIVSVSRYTATRTQEIFNLKRAIEIIHNGVTLPAGPVPCQKRNRPFRVIFAGSLLEMKGIFQLLRCWTAVLEKIPDAELHLAGKDSANQLARIIEASKNSKSVTYHGVLEKSSLNNLYRTMNVAVFPSFIESFALAPMEAMAIGLPVIFTELCSGPELIEDGVTGLLIDPHRHDSISDAIIRIAAMPSDEREKLGRQGQQRIHNYFSINRLVEDNERLMLGLARQSAFRKDL